MMKDTIKRIMDILGIDDDVEKYVDIYKRVEELFKELDKYTELDTEPLYHPLDLQSNLDEDKPKDSLVNNWPDKDDEGYVEAPPMRRR